MRKLRLHPGPQLIDLDALGGQTFVDCLLDTEPNRLDTAFRAWLYAVTESHPLLPSRCCRRYGPPVHCAAVPAALGNWPPAWIRWRRGWGCRRAAIGSAGGDNHRGAGRTPHHDTPVTPLPAPGSLAEQLDTVRGSSAADVFTAGVGGRILHYDGTAWLPMAGPTQGELACLWGSSANEVFAVGVSGTIFHYAGRAWSPMDSGTSNHLISV